MFFSIIIPVYNVEPYLRRAVDSVLNQVFPCKYEIILIDDGSTDDSGKICDEYTATASSIRVIHKANGGLSSARNAGLDVAVGEYIVFLDSDDWLERDALNFVHKSLLENSVDIFGFSYQIRKETNSETEIFHIPYATNRKVAVLDLLPQTYFMPFSWAFVFSRRFLNENQLRFVPGIYHEDEEFGARAVCLAQSGCFIDFPAYNYFQRSGSTMTNRNSVHLKKRIEDSRIVMEKLQKFQEHFRRESPQWNYLKRLLLIINYRIFRNLLNPVFDFSWSSRIYKKQKQNGYIPLPEGICEQRYSFFQILTKARVPFSVLRLLYRIIVLTSKFRKKSKAS